MMMAMECYPIAKVGGLGDVVGALSTYLNKEQYPIQIHTFIPHYHLDSLKKLALDSTYKYEISVDRFQHSVLLRSYNYLDFHLYSVEVDSLFHSSGIYADPDTKEPFFNEFERYLGFCIALLEICRQNLLGKWDIFHIHDHHLSLFSILARYHKRYHSLASIPQVLTIHNGKYQGIYPVKKIETYPFLHCIPQKKWVKQKKDVNMLASCIAATDHITTVSSQYALDIEKDECISPILTSRKKCIQGIVNGIVTNVWSPEIDKYIFFPYNRNTIIEGKQKNRMNLYQDLEWEGDNPLCCFIGRMVEEKGSDLLPEFFYYMMRHFPKLRFIVLGTGQTQIEKMLIESQKQYPRSVKIFCTYDEELAHKLYASSDFLLMPSRIEPCGLNQLYAMAYGTIPIVHSTGGLKETIIDIKEDKGRGICLPSLSSKDIEIVWKRTSILYHNYSHFSQVRKHIMELNFSWDFVIKKYLNIYTQCHSKSP